MRERSNAKRTSGRNALTGGDPLRGTGSFVGNRIGGALCRRGAGVKAEGGGPPPAGASGGERVDLRLGGLQGFFGVEDHLVGGDEFHIRDAEETEHVPEVARGEIDL